MKKFVLLWTVTVTLLTFAPSCATRTHAPVTLHQPILTPVVYNGQERYQVSKDWPFVYKGKQEVIPAGLLVDGASVPRAVWWFLPPDGLHRAAALRHDWCYILRGKLRNGEVLTRAEADLMFYSMMLESGVGSSTAAVSYQAVRSFGWVEWRKPEVGPVIVPVTSVMLKPKPTRRPLFRNHIYEH